MGSIYISNRINFLFKVVFVLGFVVVISFFYLVVGETSFNYIVGRFN